MSTTETVNGVSTLSKTISEYGPSIVILSVFLIIFLMLVVLLINQTKSQNKLMQTSNKEYLDQIIEQNKKLFDQVFEHQEKRYYDEEDIVEIFTKLNDIFKEECKGINEKINCVRTAIYVFHNGSVASHGLPFFKMSCVSEWIARGSGISEQMPKHTNLPLALFSSLIESLYKDGEAIVDKNCNEIEPSTYTFLSEHMATAIFTCVYDENNKIMAFIVSEFKQTLNSESIDKAMNIMKKSCAKIQPVLEFSSYQDKKYND